MKTKTIIVEIIIGIVCLLALWLAGGCAISESTETVIVPIEQMDGTIEFATYKSKIWQGLFLYFSSAKQIRKETPLSLTEVGEMESKPDPNSIEAVVDLSSLISPLRSF